MQAKQSKRVRPRITFHRGDGLRLALATAGLLAALVLAFFTASYILHSYEASSAARAALTAQTERNLLAQARLAAERRRIGSIVLAADTGGCEELRFDNFTGAFISVREVDCNDRLIVSGAATNAKREAGSGMHGMLDSFKK
ncbi:MAG TPA: hypothetical protein VFC54_03770 [Pseudolabrys sp.]|nr:hypothetical protein [Pseudolabrys sp.]